MTEYVAVEGGTIAYEATGNGPLVVLSHGIGDLRQSYRFLAPLLVKAGYRVAAADMRGHGDSSMGWASISRSDVASDLVALIRHLGGPLSSSANPCRAERRPSPQPRPPSSSTRSWSSTRSPAFRRPISAP